MTDRSDVNLSFDYRWNMGSNYYIHPVDLDPPGTPDTNRKPKCAHCGQYGERFQPCKHCGAPYKEDL